MDGYGRAGIIDVRAFYRDKFLTGIRYDELSAGQDFRHHIELTAATMASSPTPSPPRSATGQALDQRELGLAFISLKIEEAAGAGGK